MKKLFLILTIIISSFFFNTLVFADTVGYYSINNSYTSISEELDTLISSATSYSSSINKPYFFILTRSNRYRVYYSDSIPDIVVNFSYPSCGVTGYLNSTVSYYQYYNNNFTYFQDFNAGSDFPFSSSSSLVDSICVTDYSFIYANFPIYRYRSDVLTHIYDSFGTEFIYINSDDVPIPSLNDIYGTPPEPPEPPDSFPLLTSFYSLIVDKLVDISSYFISSYLFLSIFVIFIFYFVILLLRRLLWKILN